MPPTRFAVNGCGRIGRLVVRLAWERPEALALVSLNDIAAAESVAYMLKYDTVHGTWDVDVTVDGTDIVFTAPGGAAAGGGAPAAAGAGAPPRVLRVPYTRHATLELVAPVYKGLGVELVCECTGVFLTRAALAPYLSPAGGGVAKVIVSAPVKDADVLNVVVGVNDSAYDPKVHDIVTAASCTTNCLAPVVQVVHSALGIVHGSITTVHNVTNTQMLLDAANPKKSDLRRGRSALSNLVPTSTGSATAIALIFPELKGKLNGLAIRVPLTNASITDCVFVVRRPTTVAEVNGLLKAAADDGPLRGILGFDTAQKVSCDYINDRRSSIVDADCTQVVDGTLVKIYAWYDNEFGYSTRMVDLAVIVARSLGGGGA
jgi:glyceraldehyde 3-phosphate dehydrogenase